MRIVFGMLFFLLLFVTSGFSQGKPVRVLVLHSYHQGMSWTDGIQRGIRETFLKYSTNGNYELMVEYMDTKRYQSPEYFSRLAEVYALKYSNNRPDLILTSDDDAFHFLQDWHEKIFAGVPAVFCGVNYYTENTAARKWYTGIIEEMDIRTNFELVRKIRPDIRVLVVLNDTTTTGEANRKILESVIPDFTNRMEIRIISNATLAQACSLVSVLGPGSAVFLLTFNRGSDGQVISYEEEVENIRRVSKVPIFGVWDMFMEKGLLGGLLLSGYRQGEDAAQIGLRILGGERPSAIPVTASVGKSWIFDNRELKRFGIRKKLLPIGSRIMNSPNPFLSMKMSTALLLSLCLFFLTLLVLFLVFYVVRLKSVEDALRESNERYRSVINTNIEGYWMLNLKNEIIDVNQALCDLLGYSREEILGRSPSRFVIEENWKSLEEQLNKIPYTLQRSYELTFRGKGGRCIHAHIQSSTVRDRFGNPLYAFSFIQDVTALHMAQSVLEESERKFRILAENTVCGIVILQDGKIAYSNPAFARLIGDPAGELENLNLSDVLRAAHIQEGTDVPVPLTMRNDPLPGNYEIRIHASDDTDRWLDITASGIIPFGDRPSVLLTVFDVTQNMKSQESLRRSEALYRTLAESSRDFIFVINSNYTIAYVNHFTAERIGSRQEDLIGAPIIDLFTVEFADKMTSQLARVFQTGQAVCVEDKMIFSYHDRELWLETWIIPIQGEDGKVFAALGVARDMSDRKQMVDTIQGERKRLSIIIGSIPEGIIATSADGMIFMMNPSAGELTGWNWQDAIGAPIQRIFRAFGGMKKHEWKDLFDRALREGRSTEIDKPLTLTAKDGREKLIVGNLTPIRDIDDAISGILFVFRDIGDQVRMERRIQAMGRVESLGVLAGGIAHDFNNILTGILGNVSLARYHLQGGFSDAASVVRILNDAENACWRARDLNVQLMTYSRGNNTLVKQPENAGDIVRSVVSFVLRGSNVRAEFDIPENLAFADVDSGQLGQVIQNLVINAREAQPGGGTLRVSARNIPASLLANDPFWMSRNVSFRDYVEFSFADQGKGVMPVLLDRIFEPYFTTKKDGNGLGLAIASNIVREHEGAIAVESNPGEGSVFHVLLPAGDFAPVKREIPAQEVVKGKGRILVMDDEEFIRDVLGRMLSTVGYRSDAASDGREALEMYRKAMEEGNPYALVMMDLTVPGGMGGMELIAELKRLDPDVKAIVESGYSRDIALTDPLQFGFAGLVQKPFDIAALSAVISQVINPGI